MDDFQDQMADAAAVNSTDSPAGSDNNWLNNVPLELRNIAERYGQPVFNLTCSIGTVNYATRLIHKRTGGNHETATALNILVIQYQNLTNNYMAAVGITQESVTNCTKDIDMVGALGGRPRKLIIAH